MINKPGTLLVVRKENKSNLDGRYTTNANRFKGINGIFTIDPEAYPEKYDNPMRREWPASVDLPFGAPVLLLGLEPAPKHGSKNRTKIRLLYQDKHIVGHLSKNQIEKWFTYPNVWKNRQAASTRKKKKLAKSAS